MLRSIWAIMFAIAVSAVAPVEAAENLDCPLREINQAERQQLAQSMVQGGPAGAAANRTVIAAGAACGRQHQWSPDATRLAIFHAVSQLLADNVYFDAAVTDADRVMIDQGIAAISDTERQQFLNAQRDALIDGRDAFATSPALIEIAVRWAERVGIRMDGSPRSRQLFAVLLSRTNTQLLAEHFAGL